MRGKKIFKKVSVGVCAPGNPVSPCVPGSTCLGTFEGGYGLNCVSSKDVAGPMNGTLFRGGVLADDQDEIMREGGPDLVRLVSF